MCSEYSRVLVDIFELDLVLIAAAQCTVWITHPMPDGQTSRVLPFIVIIKSTGMNILV